MLSVLTAAGPKCMGRPLPHGDGSLFSGVLGDAESPKPSPAPPPGGVLGVGPPTIPHGYQPAGQEEEEDGAAPSPTLAFPGSISSYLDTFRSNSDANSADGNHATRIVAVVVLPAAFLVVPVMCGGMMLCWRAKGRRERSQREVEAVQQQQQYHAEGGPDRDSEVSFPAPKVCTFDTIDASCVDGLWKSLGIDMR